MDNMSKSHGLSLSQAEAEHNSAQGLGLTFFQAWAAKAEPKPWYPGQAKPLTSLA